MSLRRARISACLIAILLAFVAVPTAALAQGSSTSTTSSPTSTVKDPYGERTELPDLSGGGTSASPGGNSGSLVRTIVGLAIVIAVIYGLTWVMRQMKASKEERTLGTGLEIAATVPLSSSRSVHLVRAGSEYVLVGSAENGVTPIRTYTEDEVYELGLLSEDDDEHGGGRSRRRGLLAGAVDRLRERTLR